MRFLVKATIPVEMGNALVRDPNMGKRMEDILGDLKPEAVYFVEDDGQRTMYLVVHIDDASQLATIAEPLWLSLKADVKVMPAMVQADLEKAMASLQNLIQKY